MYVTISWNAVRKLKLLVIIKKIETGAKVIVSIFFYTTLSTTVLIEVNNYFQNNYFGNRSKNY